MKRIKELQNQIDQLEAELQVEIEAELNDLKKAESKYPMKLPRYESKSTIKCNVNKLEVGFNSTISAPIYFADAKTTELFLETFRKELEQVKEYL